MFKYLDTRVCCLFVFFFVCKVFGNSCGECDPESCEPPQDCLAGRTKDDCDCCDVCGVKENDRCDYEDLNIVGFGKCGDNLECRARSDLHWDDPPEAVCVCSSQNRLCGSDGITYDNICQLTEARYRRRDGLRAVSAEPCVKPPKIVAAPQNIRNATGTSSTMTCEASAWPVPTIRWFVKRSDGLHELPGNSTRVAVQSRSGPEDDETTSWLFFLGIAEEDQGFYSCQAENDLGSAMANATLYS